MSTLIRYRLIDWCYQLINNLNWWCIKLWLNEQVGGGGVGGGGIIWGEEIDEN